jgi:hypothetical protein
MSIGFSARNALIIRGLWLHDIASEVDHHCNTFSDFGRELYPYVHLARDQQGPQTFIFCGEAIERRLNYPHWYRCAAGNCTIEADTSGTFSRCERATPIPQDFPLTFTPLVLTGAGLCHKEIKPRYCSWQCQRADWETHRPFCRPGVETSVRKTSKLGQMDPVFPHPMRETLDGTLSIYCQHPRSQYITSLRSATMTSAQFKALKEITEAPEMVEERLIRHGPWVSTYFTR